MRGLLVVCADALHFLALHCFGSASHFPLKPGDEPGLLGDYAVELLVLMFEVGEGGLEFLEADFG